MNKKIEFEDNGQKYTLEYTRESVALMERKGFKVDEISSKPMVMLPLAFEGLFYKNHRNVSPQIVDEIYDRFSDKNKLIEVISDMLSETYESLLDTKKVSDKGNIDWKIV